MCPGAGSVSLPTVVAVVGISVLMGLYYAHTEEQRSEHVEVNAGPYIYDAADDELNTVTGLSMGADDYVAKPFRPRELVARIQAAIRRARLRLGGSQTGFRARGLLREHVLSGCQVLFQDESLQDLLWFGRTRPLRITWPPIIIPDWQGLAM